MVHHVGQYPEMRLPLPTQARDGFLLSFQILPRVGTGPYKSGRRDRRERGGSGIFRDLESGFIQVSDLGWSGTLGVRLYKGRVWCRQDPRDLRDLGLSRYGTVPPVTRNRGVQVFTHSSPSLCFRKGHSWSQRRVVLSPSVFFVVHPTVRDPGVSSSLVLTPPVVSRPPSFRLNVIPSSGVGGYRGQIVKEG